MRFFKLNKVAGSGFRIVIIDDDNMSETELISLFSEKFNYHYSLNELSLDKDNCILNYDCDSYDG